MQRRNVSSAINCKLVRHGEVVIETAAFVALDVKQ